jgi:hypothetical protein
MLSNGIRNFSIHCVLTLAIALWRFESASGLQLPKWKLLWECEGSFPHTFFHSWASLLACNLVSPCLGCEPKARVVTNKVSQIFMAIHDFLWHHKFWCVLNLWHWYLSCHAIFFCLPWSFWSHEFTSMCICTKQSIVNYNYDYNINSHFEKGDT